MGLVVACSAGSGSGLALNGITGYSLALAAGAPNSAIRPIAVAAKETAAFAAAAPVRPAMSLFLTREVPPKPPPRH